MRLCRSVQHAYQSKNFLRLAVHASNSTDGQLVVTVHVLENKPNLANSCCSFADDRKEINRGVFPYMGCIGNVCAAPKGMVFSRFGHI